MWQVGKRQSVVLDRAGEEMKPAFRELRAEAKTWGYLEVVVSYLAAGLFPLINICR